jgi:hypothetical protein
MDWAHRGTITRRHGGRHWEEGGVVGKKIKHFFTGEDEAIFLRDKMQNLLLKIRSFREHQCGGSHHYLPSFYENGEPGLVEIT